MPTTIEQVTLKLPGAHAFRVRTALELYHAQLAKLSKKNQECAVEDNTALMMADVEAVLTQLEPQVDMFSKAEPESFSQRVDPETGEVLGN
jgi:hypothetical protein